MKQMHRITRVLAVILSLSLVVAAITPPAAILGAEPELPSEAAAWERLLANYEYDEHGAMIVPQPPDVMEFVDDFALPGDRGEAFPNLSLAQADTQPGPFRVGDTRDMSCLVAIAPSDRYEMVQAKLMAQGQHSNIWVLDCADYHAKSGTTHSASCLLDKITTQQANDIAAVADGIYARMTDSVTGYGQHAYFKNYYSASGFAGDLDEDGMMNYCLYSLNFGTAGAYAGFFYSADSWTSKLDVVHITISGLLGNDPLYYYGTLAHEFQHFLYHTYYGTFSPTNDSWINEALADSAKLYYLQPEMEVPVSGRMGQAAYNSYNNSGNYADFVSFQSAKGYGTGCAFSLYMFKRIGPTFASRVYDYIKTEYPKATSSAEWSANRTKISGKGGMMQAWGDVFQAVGVGGTGRMDSFGKMYFGFMESFGADGGVIRGATDTPTIKLFAGNDTNENLWSLRNTTRIPEVIYNGGAFDLCGWPLTSPRATATHERFYRLDTTGAPANPVLNITVADSSAADSTKYYVALKSGGTLPNADLYPLVPGTQSSINTNGREAYLYAVTLNRRAQGTVSFNWAAPPASVLTGTVALSTSTPRTGNAITATPAANGVTYNYQWYAGSTPVGGNSNIYTCTNADIGKVIKVVVTSSTGTPTGKIEAQTAAVLKATGPVAPAAPVLASKTDKSVTLVAVPGYEYSNDKNTVAANMLWQDSPVFTGLTPGASYPFYQRIKATDTAVASARSTVLNVTTDAAPTYTISGITVTPAAPSVQKGNTQQFAAVVAGASAPQSVVWSVAGRKHAGTNISPAGLLTVHEGETAANLTVIARSAADASKTGSTIVAVGEVPTYGIVLDKSGTQTLAAATFGYGTSPSVAVQISNTGNQPTGALTIGLSGTNAGNYNLSATSVANIAVDGNSSFTVSPKTGLGAGIHTATVTVSGSSVISRSFNVTFTVNKAAGAAVSAPAVVGSPTTTGITVSATTPANGQAVEYAYSATSAAPGSGWQSSGTFSGLTPDTQYYFFARSATHANYNAGTASSGTAIRTAVVPTYSITLDRTGTQNLGAAAYGYTAQTPLAVRVNNTGNQPTGVLAVALSGANAGSFTLSTSSVANIAAGGNTPNAFTVAPITGLAVGSYSATVTVTGGNGITAAFSVSFTVNAADIASPAIAVTAPVMNATPNTTATGTGNFSIGMVTWTPGGSPFAVNTAYTARVTLTANANYSFANLTTATINGQAATLSAKTAGSVTLAYTFPATGATPTYGITLDKTGAQSFGTMAYGYPAQTPLAVQIFNTGNQPTGGLTVALSGANAGSFSLSTTSVAGMAAGGNTANAFTVAPKAGLAVGSYSATVTVTGGNGISANFTVTFMVTAADITTAAVTVTAPVAGALPNTAASCTGNYTVGPVTWAPGHSPFRTGTVYTTSVTITANDNYSLANIAIANINGLTATVSEKTASSVKLTCEFPATGATTPTPTATLTPSPTPSPTPTLTPVTPSLPATPTPDDSPRPVLPGDANCDGNVDINDILLVRDVIFGLKTLPPQGYANLLLPEGERVTIDQILFIRDVIFGVYIP